MIIDRMGIARKSENDVPDYGSLYMIDHGFNNVNEYGGDDDDSAKLVLLTNAAPGSTCLFDNGDLYRKGLTSWVKLEELG